VSRVRWPKLTPSQAIERASRAAAILFDRPHEQTLRAAERAFDLEGSVEPLMILIAIYGQLPKRNGLRLVKGGAS
jgi:hypothetical protein